MFNHKLGLERTRYEFYTELELNGVIIQCNLKGSCIRRIFFGLQRGSADTYPGPDRIMSGNWGVVAIWVTHPLWPLRVPLTVICSVILAQERITYKGGCCWILSEGRVPLYLSRCGKRKRKKNTGSKTLEGEPSSSSAFSCEIANVNIYCHLVCRLQTTSTIFLSSHILLLI